MIFYQVGKHHSLTYVVRSYAFRAGHQSRQLMVAVAGSAIQVAQYEDLKKSCDTLHFQEF